MKQAKREEIEACIKNCIECHASCVTTLQHCIGLNGKHTEPAHLRILMNCAEICQTSANFMLSGSDFHAETCGVCAEVCQRCAVSCESIAEEDVTMKRCADLCRRCADSCARMSGRKLAA